MANDVNDEVLVEFVEFEPKGDGTREDRMLHALEYIAQALILLLKDRVAQHGIGRGGLGT